MQAAFDPNKLGGISCRDLISTNMNSAKITMDVSDCLPQLFPFGCARSCGERSCPPAGSRAGHNTHPHSRSVGGSSCPLKSDPIQVKANPKKSRAVIPEKTRCCMEFTSYNMTHFRGQIRGPHWGPTMDKMLIDFWRKNECLFNPSIDSYYDKELKTKLWTEFAQSIGKPVSDVERRSRSLRTQYGRVLWHPERVSTVQQKMLREKLDFLRPYIVRRRGESYLEEKSDDREEDDEEELETEGSFDQEIGSSFGSPLDADVAEEDLNEESRSVTSTPNPTPLQCPNPQPQVTEVISMSCSHRHSDECSADQPDQTAAPNSARHDILNQFAEVMLADMRQIKDPFVLMRLRRDITDLVFKAVEEDVQRQCVQMPPTPVLRKTTRSSIKPQQSYPQTNVSWRQRFLRRKNKGCELGRKMQRWEEIKHMRRVSRSHPIQQGQAAEGMSEISSQVIVPSAEIKRETEPHIVKIEEEVPLLA